MIIILLLLEPGPLSHGRRSRDWLNGCGRNDAHPVLRPTPLDAAQEANTAAVSASDESDFIRNKQRNVRKFRKITVWRCLKRFLFTPPRQLDLPAVESVIGQQQLGALLHR